MLTITTERPNGTRRVQLQPEDPSMTEANHADYCDINEIMRRYRETGYIPQKAGSPLYGDFTNAQDYMDCCQRLKDADEAFDTIAPEIRTKFNNDPAALIEFVNNPKNATEAAEMGLIELPKMETKETPIASPEPSQSPTADAVAVAAAARNDSG